MEGIALRRVEEALNIQIKRVGFRRWVREQGWEEKAFGYRYPDGWILTGDDSVVVFEVENTHALTRDKLDCYAQMSDDIGIPIDICVLNRYGAIQYYISAEELEADHLCQYGRAINGNKLSSDGTPVSPSVSATLRYYPGGVAPKEGTNEQDA